MDSFKTLLSQYIFLLLLSISLAQIAEKLTAQNPCVHKTTCHDCIRTPSCAWCYKKDYNDNRCFQPAGSHSNQCPEEWSYNPGNVYSVLQNISLSEAHQEVVESGSGSFSSQEKLVQIAPQKIKLKIRAKQSFSLNMSYSQAKDYPVDLYYLMDLSNSMKDDKDKLSSLGNLLADTMKKITSNFRLGFGSFVDKVVMPYVSTLESKLKRPCSECEPPYGFRNRLNLSTNTSEFSEMVRKSQVSGNLDGPEGGFDAIMQAIVCREKIGWREQARRLLVFSTDAGFHYAGDGKLGGIVKPNDGLCHLDQNNNYDYSILQDYPSISQINHKVKEHSINLIFAVTHEQINIYQELQQHVEGSFCGQLSNDSSNIVELVKGLYEQIRSTVEVKSKSSSHVKIKYFSKCLDSTGPEKETNKCGNIKVGDVVEFRIEIELKECPKDPKDWKETIQIYAVGLDECLTIDLEMLCSCECEKPGSKFYIEHAAECNGFGTYMCGICECDDKRFGRYCNCTEAQDLNVTNLCRPNNFADVDCSGRGKCVCGRCECDPRLNENERIYGAYCQCDNFLCPRLNNTVCNNQGVCDCGVCNCNEPWTGDNCGCYNNNEKCYSNDGKLCSGHGTCECGMCKCENSSDARYSGQHCEICLTCSDRCAQYKDCVQCLMYKTGPLKEAEDCKANCTTFTPIAVDVVEIKKEDEFLCAYYDEEDCRFSFVYTVNETGQAFVKAQQERECPPKVFLVGIILGVIAAIVLMGLAILLLWKLLTTIHDRREFAKFEKERMMAKWDTGENPIYKQATSTFKNPTYAGKG